MLKKPYKLVFKKGINRYYTLGINDEKFLAIETVVNVPKPARLRGMAKEFTQALKLLPLSSPILYMLMAFNMIDGVEEVENELGFKEQRYPLIDIAALRDMIKKYLDEHKNDIDASLFNRYSFVDSVNNDFVKALIGQGYNILFVDKEGSKTNTIWLVRSSILGGVRLFELITSGGDGFDVLLHSTTYSLDIPLIKEIMGTIATKEELH